MKSKVYVRNYENISDLISTIISAFQEVSDGMEKSDGVRFQPWRTSVDDWKWSFGIREDI